MGKHEPLYQNIYARDAAIKAGLEPGAFRIFTGCNRRGEYTETRLHMKEVTDLTPYANALAQNGYAVTVARFGDGKTYTSTPIYKGYKGELTELRYTEFHNECKITKKVFPDKRNRE